MAPPDLRLQKDAECPTNVGGPLKSAPLITLSDQTFSVNGYPFLHDVPVNVVATPASASVPDATGTFIGFDSPDGIARSWHAFPIGRLFGIRFMSIFRFKIWWATHWVGDRGRDVEHETLIMILDRSTDDARPYVLFLPLIEGPFRACLQPGVDDNIEVCVESGSSHVTESSFRSSVYVHSGGDPFALVQDAVKVVRAHLGTFRLLEEKIPPGIVDKFGWCTWDAFYLKVHPDGVWEGVKGLVEGGCPPGMVLIDDGWQSICHDKDDPASVQEGMSLTSAGDQMPCRLIRFQENSKFRDYKSPIVKDGSSGMGTFIRDLKSAFKSVKQVYAWHALCGYWGGLRPGTCGLPETKMVAPKLSPGLATTMEDLAVEKMVSNGVGLVPPEKVGEMYEGLHSHLASVGIDGVKVDVMNLLEMVCEEYGGRVELAKAYYQALTASVKRHFNGNAVIASMEHGNDFMFLGTDSICLGRVGDDFWCADPSGDPEGTFWLQGCHMVHCAYNSLWMGNFIHPDWDMFQSTHPCAEFHAASRAISGGPIYVSDPVGQHDFRLLKSLVLPDGTILRCAHYALPTRDCLFCDTLHDGKSMLKIWNMNKHTGVLGLFNCHGGGWCRQSRRNKRASDFSHNVSSATARPSDIEWSHGKTPIPIDGVELFAVYSFGAGKLALLKPDDGIDITLEPLKFELLTVSPAKSLYSSKKTAVQFAPIGLANMLNTGGAIVSVELIDGVGAKVGVKGGGEMKAFSSEKPASCWVNGEEAAFTYEDSLISLHVPCPGSSELSPVHYYF